MKMPSISWRFFTSKKGRSFFSVLGISLGVMMLIISQILLYTVEKSNEKSVKQKFGNYDMLAGYQTNEFQLSKQDISFIDAVPGVVQSSPLLYPYLGKNNPQSELLEMPTYVGLKDDSLSKEHPFLNIGEGAFPKQDEVVLPVRYLKAQGLKIGSIIEMPFPPNGKKKVRVSGTFSQKEKLDYIALFDYDWLSQATSNENKTTVVMLKLSSRSYIETVSKNLKEKFPDIYVDGRKGMDKEKENIGGLKPFIYILTIGSIIGSILIVISTLQMAIQERQRDLATLRLLGAQRAQLFTLILVESLIIGILASIVSVGLGTQAASLSKGFVEQLMNVHIFEIIIPWNSVIISAIAGILLTILSGIVPAYSAMKLPPIAAYRQSEQVSERLNPWITIGGLVLLILSFLIAASNYFYLNGPSWVYLLTGGIFFISMFLNIPLVIRIMVKLFTLIAKPILSSEGYISGQNVLRQMKRNIQIASILVLALIIGFTGYMLFGSIVHQAEQTIRSERLTSYTILSSESSLEPGFSSELADQVKKIDGIQSITVPTSVFGLTLNLDQDYARKWKGQLFHVNGQQQAHLNLGAMDMKTASEFKPIYVLEGTIDQNALRNNGVVITKDMKDLGYKLGDTIQIGRYDEVLKGDKGHSFQIVGIIRNMPLSPDDEYKIYTDAVNLERYFHINKIQQIQYNIIKKNKAKDIQNKVETLLKNPSFSNTVLYDRAQELQKLKTQATQRMLILLIIVILMTSIAFIGLMNSMASCLQERKREFAVLRAIGSRKKQVVRLALLEGIIVTMSGGIVGIITGVALGYHVLAGLEAEHYILPIPLILIGLFASPLIGALSTLFPSIWISKMDLIKTLRED
ncbi:FtsX-like permease family protein [Bacillus sp. TL12]|uniref:ABC transporter permease n=1 Tax=Bacillus sp. TL12 TaxID=2894756 RepID=UPI001F51B8FF|nr:FtsX-like permease family protein [Bacillus sp. TL12]MCI0768215.1 FtsX-like permease family protein [Bacillus sp. TL12]